MRDFLYLAPRSLEEALLLLGKHAPDCRPLAGGTDLIVKMKDGLVHPSYVLDLSRLDELRFIREEGGLIKIGALASHAMIARSLLIREKASLLAKACAGVGGPQIRNVGTIGGNIVNASPAGDSIPPLYVLGATLTLESVKGSREIPVERFFRGPGQTIIEPDEILTCVSFSPPSPLAYTDCQKLRARKSLAVAKVSLAFFGLRDGPGFSEVRIALGAVAPTVIRAPEAEAALTRGPLASESLKEAARRCAESARPIDDVRSTERYRRDMCAALLYRALSPLIKATG